MPMVYPIPEFEHLAFSTLLNSRIEVVNRTSMHGWSELLLMKLK